MPYTSYLTIDDYSTIWQNGCLPLAWLAVLRDAEPLLNSEATGFGGWRTTPWEATNSIDRAINVLQRDSYLWAYFNVLSLLLDEIQQVPTEEDIVIDVSEFVAFGAAQAQAAEGAGESFREILRMIHRGETDAAHTAMRELAAALNLDRGLPFSGTLAGDIAALGGAENTLQELTWSIMGERYDGPEERTEWYTAAYYQENFWQWLTSTTPDSTPTEVIITPEIHHNGHSPDK